MCVVAQALVCFVIVWFEADLCFCRFVGMLGVCVDVLLFLVLLFPYFCVFDLAVFVACFASI